MKTFVTMALWTVIPLVGFAASENANTADYGRDAISNLQPLSLSSGVAVLAANQAQPQAVFQQGFDYVFPELILGGEWSSTIKLTNRSAISIPSTNVYFIDDLGNPMTTTFQNSAGNMRTDVGFSFSLAPGGMIEGTFFGGTSTQFGHAFVALCPSSGACLSGVYGEVTLRNRNATRPDFEAVFPLEQPTSLQYMLWDHRNGLTTVLYLVNENSTKTSISLTFTDTSNRLIRTVNVTLPALGCDIETLNSLVPETSGKQGTLAISGQNSSGTAFVTATALRINPSNSFTPMRAFVPKL
jgi:hypothetical protein